jgi:hypothetical protein
MRKFALVRLGCRGQRYSLAVGFSLPNSHDHRKEDSGPRAVILATNTRKSKASP